VRKNIIELIFKIAKEKNAFDTLENHLSTLSRQDLSENLIDCGILPEMFKQNGSEEKLWAKFSDILLAKSLNFLGIESIVIKKKSDSADVLGKSTNYTIVGDAKTFRLSRTTINQKDLKISSLNDWKGDNDFSLLIAPLTQLPNTKSQIYSQAIKKNVTLVSYTHFHFLLDFHTNQDLKSLWEIGNDLSKIIKKSDLQNSNNYWNAIDERFCKVLGQNLDILAKYKQIEIDKTKEIGKESVKFWKNKIAEFQHLSKEEAVRLLIKSEKIETKIKTIEKAIKL
jgi:HindIII restriction endonuclease